MESKAIINIQTLGKLNISQDNISFPLDKKRSAQVELLIIYLIMNRNRNISTSNLIDFLWPDGNSDKPEGALRNLVYRARKEMSKFYDDIPCIQSRGRGYCWNLDIECRIDFEDVLKLAKGVDLEKTLMLKYEKCLEMLTRYDNQFLPEYNYNDWIIEMDNSLQTTCIDMAVETLQALYKENKFHEMLRILNHNNIQRLMDSRLYEMKLYAYYKSGQIDTALAFYRQIVESYSHRYGIEVSPSFRKIYDTILDTMPATQINVDELENNLSSASNIESTFYCDFEIFKNIYQVNLRSARRSMKARVLSLLSLHDISNCLTDKQLKEESDILRQVIASCLRKNDVYSKFNMTQYSLIIASPDIQGAKIAAERILNKFNEKKQHEEVKLEYDLKKIN